LARAIEAEVAEFLQQHRKQKDESGALSLVRNGYLPSRTIQTGIGAVPVTAPRVRDRAGAIRDTSSILPPYLRRTKSIEERLPWLYRQGISTGGFSSGMGGFVGQRRTGTHQGYHQPLKNGLASRTRPMGAKRI